jgi:hypothetical protein
VNLQETLAVAGTFATAALGLFKYFNYRTRHDRMTLVGQAFATTVEGLAAEVGPRRLASAILLRRFFDRETEQGTAGTPYEREAIAVIAALLREVPTGDFQKLLADGLAYASTLEGADLQGCNLSGAYWGQRRRAPVSNTRARLSRRSILRRQGKASHLIEHASAPVNLGEADLFKATMQGASLRNANAQGSVFYLADARHVIFNGARLEGADFRQAQLGGASFDGAWLNGARFEGAEDIPFSIAALLDERSMVPRDVPMPLAFS